jgi:formylglycine-generating enzyme required for sulfatase activity
VVNHKVSKLFLIIVLLIVAFFIASSTQVTAQSVFKSSQSAESSTDDQGEPIGQSPSDSGYVIYLPFFQTWKPREIKLIRVPAGEFTMGSDTDGDPATSPQRRVYLDAFDISETMVTNAQFAEFVNEKDYETTAEKVGWSYVGQYLEKRNGAYWAAPLGPGSNVLGKDDFPVLHASWEDGMAFCDWYVEGGRLPTEAEWEKAARGPSGRIYPWGGSGRPDVTGDKANFCDVNCPYDVPWKIADQNDGHATSSPAGNYPNGASIYGVMDMAGNLNEWVKDYYAADYYQYAPYNNPTGPASGTFRVERGGSWVSGWSNLRSFHRNYETQDHTHDLEGFRCVVPETP